MVPESFSKRFGKLIPASVTFALKNGHILSGKYIQCETKLIGLLEMIGSDHVHRKDILLFTYQGEGRFDLVLFDKTKVEKIFERDLDEKGKQKLMLYS